MNEPEYERTYDSYFDYIEYLLFLIDWETNKRSQESAQQKETCWWHTKDDLWHHASRTGKSVPKWLLLATGTKTSDWTQGQGTRPRKQKDEGTTKGSREVAVPLRQGMQGDGEEGICRGCGYCYCRCRGGQ